MLSPVLETRPRLAGELARRVCNDFPRGGQSHRLNNPTPCNEGVSDHNFTPRLQIIEENGGGRKAVPGHFSLSGSLAMIAAWAENSGLSVDARGPMLLKTFRCYFVTQDAAGQVSAKIMRRPIDELPAGDVVVASGLFVVELQGRVGGHRSSGRRPRFFPTCPGSMRPAWSPPVACRSSPSATGDRDRLRHGREPLGRLCRVRPRAAGSGSCRCPPG